jgi:hypothetical protein
MSNRKIKLRPAHVCLVPVQMTTSQGMQLGIFHPNTSCKRNEVETAAAYKRSRRPRHDHTHSPRHVRTQHYSPRRVHLFDPSLSRGAGCCCCGPSTSITCRRACASSRRKCMAWTRTTCLRCASTLRMRSAGCCLVHARVAQCMHMRKAPRFLKRIPCKLFCMRMHMFSACAWQVIVRWRCSTRDTWS